MIKRILTTIIILWIIITGLYLFGAGYYKNNVVKHPLKLDANSYDLKINKGDTLYSVVDSLNKSGKLNNGYLVKYYIKSHGITLGLKPGVYTLTKEMALVEFLDYLEKGSGVEDPNVVKVTIPEGYDLEKIAATLESKGLVKKDDFIKSCKQYALPKYIKSDSKRKYALEGFLFPDTYEFTKDTKPEKIIETMIKRFEYVIDDIQKKKNTTIESKDLDKLIIMASIVEKEVEKPEERVLASSVFNNRLSKGMKLESCATVLYALGVHKDKVLNADLKVESPYNTYIVNALPVGPICSPGRASIEAALEPAKTNYLYFVSRNDGTHEFNESFAAHTAATKKYQSGN